MYTTLNNVRSFNHGIARLIANRIANKAPKDFNLECRRLLKILAALEISWGAFSEICDEVQPQYENFDTERKGFLFGAICNAIEEEYVEALLAAVPTYPAETDKFSSCPWCCPWLFQEDDTIKTPSEYAENCAPELKRIMEEEIAAQAEWKD